MKTSNKNASARLGFGAALAIAALAAPLSAQAAGEGRIILAQATQTATDRSVELTFWNSVENSGDIADYQAYLDRYPDGDFAPIARNRLAAAGREAEPAPASGASSASSEQALGLDRTRRMDIQRDLTTLGYDTRGIDGIFGAGTRGSIRNWQDSETLPATGYLNEEQIARLGEAADGVARERETAARLSPEEAERREARLWRRTDAVGSAAAYQAYLEEYPDGRYAPEAKRALEDAETRAEAVAWTEAKERSTTASYKNYLERYPEGPNALLAAREQGRLEAAGAAPGDEAAAWSRAEEADNEAAYEAFRDAYPEGRFAEEAETRRLALVSGNRESREAALELTPQAWRSVEQRLAFLGFEPGAQDGDVTNETRVAIRKYRRSRGMDAHRYADDQFVSALVAETENAAPANPAAELLDGIFKALQE